MISQNRETLQNVSIDFVGSVDDLKTLIATLEFELRSNPSQRGVGLSGIQINVPVRVAIIRDGKTAINLFNAKIIKQEQPFVFKGEGCLSFPGEYRDTKRYNQVTIKNGDGEELKLSGFLAVVAQHEIGHWDGQIFLDMVDVK